MKWDLEYTREDIPVLGRLVSIAEDNVLASADQIWDEELHQEQSSLNDEFKGKLLQLENKNVYIIVDSTVLGALESRQITLNQNSEITTNPEDVQRTILSISIGAITSATRQHINLTYEKLVESGGVRPSIVYRFSTIFVDSEGYSTMASVSISEQNFLRLATENVDVQLTITPLISSDSAEGGSNLYWPDTTFVQNINILREIDYPLLSGQQDCIPATQAVAGYVSDVKDEITSEYQDFVAQYVEENVPVVNLDNIEDGTDRKWDNIVTTEDFTQLKLGSLFIGNYTPGSSSTPAIQLRKDGLLRLYNPNNVAQLQIANSNTSVSMAIDPSNDALDLRVGNISVAQIMQNGDLFGEGDGYFVGDVWENETKLSDTYLKKDDATLLNLEYRDSTGTHATRIDDMNVISDGGPIIYGRSDDPDIGSNARKYPSASIGTDEYNHLITYRGIAQYIDQYYVPAALLNTVNGKSIYRPLRDTSGGVDDISSIRSGATSQRPINGLSNGYQYFDLTLNQPIWYAGNKWVDANGFTPARKNGTTAQRPTLDQNDAGFMYFDTTFGTPIYWSGVAWVDANGMSV